MSIIQIWFHDSSDLKKSILNINLILQKIVVAFKKRLLVQDQWWELMLEDLCYFSLRYIGKLEYKTKTSQKVSLISLLLWQKCLSTMRDYFELIMASQVFLSSSAWSKPNEVFTKAIVWSLLRYLSISGGSWKYYANWSVFAVFYLLLVC